MVREDDVLIKEDLRRVGNYLEVEELHGLHIFISTDWVSDGQRWECLEEKQFRGDRRKIINFVLDFRL